MITFIAKICKTKRLTFLEPQLSKPVTAE